MEGGVSMERVAMFLVCRSRCGGGDTIVAHVMYPSRSTAVLFR